MNKIVIVAAAVIAVVAGAAGYLLRQQAPQNAEPAAAVPKAANQNASHDPALPRVPPPSMPDARIAFTLSDLDGNPHALSEWKGKARLVNFWATWCAPCRREIPLLKKAQTDHADDLQVIGVAVDFHDDVVAYAESADFNYPILIGQDDAMAAAETSGVPFIGLPFTMIVAADGKLIKAHMGEIAADQLETIVDVVAGLQTGAMTLAEARGKLDNI